MNKIHTLLFAFTLLFGLSACSQTVDDVIRKYQKAIGGEEAWKKVNTLKAIGTISTTGEPIQLTMIAMNGKAFRTDYTMGGMSGYSIVTSNGGWFTRPSAGEAEAEIMPAEQLHQSQNELDLQGKLIDYKAKGHTVKYMGDEELDGKKVHKLALTLKSGKMETWYIDAATNYVARTISKKNTDGKEVSDTISYSNYKKLPLGIVYPMTLATRNGNINFSSVEINTPIDDKVFIPHTKSPGE
jgi:hypothetical protein